MDTIATGSAAERKRYIKKKGDFKMGGGGGTFIGSSGSRNIRYQKKEMVMRGLQSNWLGCVHFTVELQSAGPERFFPGFFRGGGEKASRSAANSGGGFVGREDRVRKLERFSWDRRKMGGRLGD